MIAELVQQSEATFNTCFQFRRCYEPEDLPELERLGAGWARPTIALGIADRKKRQQLLMRASNDGWDGQELQREVQWLKGSRRGGGRPRKRSRSHGLLADLSELIRLTDVWNDFYDGVFAAVQKIYTAEMDKMTSEAKFSVSEHVTNAIEQLERLQERSGKALRSLAAIQRRIGPPKR